ncbi:MAG: hypothetical protein ACTSRZ_17570 [Promethearchaeota archaeon]
MGIKEKEGFIISYYYKGRDQDCENKEIVIAMHLEILYKKLYSKGRFAFILYLRYIKKLSVKQILQEVSYLKIRVYYEIINTYRGAAKVRADKRIAHKFPPITKIRMFIDTMEPKKG